MSNFKNPPCLGKTALFYPPDNTPRDQRMTLEQMAKDICTECPYRAECLELGVENETHGVWGGANATELATIRKVRGIHLYRSMDLLKHKFCGTEQGFHYAASMGFQCRECNKAHEAFLNPKEETDWHPCGTERGYQVLYLRNKAKGGRNAGYAVTCKECLLAHSQHGKDKRDMKRRGLL